MLPNGKTLVINVPGTVPRLPIHKGALQRLYEEGIVPDAAFATSAGSMDISAVAGWNDEAFKNADEVIGNLTPRKIFTLNHGVKVKLATLAAVSVGVTLFLHLNQPAFILWKVLSIFAGLFALLMAIGMVGREILRSQSLLSIEPLLTLLKGKLDWPSIANSPIHIFVMATDMGKPGPVFFSNRDPLSSDPKDASHFDRWLKILHASSRLFGKFPFVQLDGINLGDGEAWTDFPIHHMRNYNDRDPKDICIVRFDYWSPLQPAPPAKDWISDITSSFDRMRDLLTQKKFENLRYEGPPAVFTVRASDELLAQLPDIKIHSFSSSDMRHSINLGYRIMDENMPALRAYLGLDPAPDKK